MSEKLKTQERKSLVKKKSHQVYGHWKFNKKNSSSGSSVGIVLIPPNGEPKPMTFKLKFRNKKNTTEYEALLVGIIAMK